jgi:ATPase subunit of ABC transporter with duplicated ATPase domains
MITITNLAKNYGTQLLFADVNLQLNAGSRYGIVGSNGSGKSTLLRILTDEESASDGQVTKQRRARIGVLGQDHFQYEQIPILHVVMMGHTELWEAMEEKEALLARAHEHFDEDRYVVLEDTIMRLDGYTLESKAAQILEGLGIPTDKHMDPMRALSGGYKLRALLGQTLAADPDILLLDEPTNHLDILSIDWLEDFLRGYRGCAVVVSHDHRFLNRVCTHILDVDYSTVGTYKGNYDNFEKQKAEHRNRMEAEIGKREKEVADHKAFINRFRAKASKARQANSRAKQLDKIVINDLPRSSRRHPGFRFIPRRPSGREVLEVKGIWKSYGDNSVLEEVGFEINRGERVAIIGQNGIGKSTLLKILMGQTEACAGEFRWGFECDLGYFPQDHHESFKDPKETVLNTLWGTKPDAAIGYVHGKLAEVLFAKDDMGKRIEHLSGGEAARLLFAILGIRQSTVMVLDEPTNHLDIEGIHALATSLQAYEGTLLFVSHDRWFVDKVATRILEITPEGVNDFRGTYAEFLQRGEADHLDAAAVKEQARQDKRSEKKGKKAKKEKKGKKGQARS